MDSTSNWNWNLIAPNALHFGIVEAQHLSIASAIEGLPQDDLGENDTDAAEIADNPRIHESIEDEVIHPAEVPSEK